MKATQRRSLLAVLAARFAANSARHPGTAWDEVRSRLEANPRVLESLMAMEASGGEPDVVGRDAAGVVFFDCSAESPAGRRGTCFDGAARRSRKEAAPERSALEMAAEMGIELLDEARYRHLQSLGEFDRRTSSWLATPAPVRALGGALFGDRRYGRVFVYHNGAQSYYAARGFRGFVIA